MAVTENTACYAHELRGRFAICASEQAGRSRILCAERTKHLPTRLAPSLLPLVWVQLRPDADEPAAKAAPGGRRARWRRRPRGAWVALGSDSQVRVRADEAPAQAAPVGLEPRWHLAGVKPGANEANGLLWRLTEVLVPTKRARIACMAQAAGLVGACGVAEGKETGTCHETRPRYRSARYRGSGGAVHSASQGPVFRTSVLSWLRSGNQDNPYSSTMNDETRLIFATKRCTR